MRFKYLFIYVCTLHVKANTGVILYKRNNISFYTSCVMKTTLASYSHISHRRLLSTGNHVGQTEWDEKSDFSEALH